MTLPNFLIIGSQKCGTTSLHDLLEEHPQANMTKIKELRFFDQISRFSKGKEFYSSFFKRPKSDHIVTGEASPGYICNPGAAKRIYDTLGPELKLVIILRDPIKRAFSQYWDNRRKLNEAQTEQQIISEYLEPIYNPNRKGYFSRGVYLQYIKEYLEFFENDNLHIVILEELIKNQQKGLHDLYKFLEIDPSKGMQKLPSASNQSMIYRNPLYLLRNF